VNSEVPFKAWSVHLSIFRVLRVLAVNLRPQLLWATPRYDHMTVIATLPLRRFAIYAALDHAFTF
jgi:hypothetical protein